MSAIGQSAVYSAADLDARAHRIHLPEDVFDKMEPALCMRLCSVEHVTDDVVHLINCIKNSCNSLKDGYVSLFRALFSRGGDEGIRHQNKVMED